MHITYEFSKPRKFKEVIENYNKINHVSDGDEAYTVDEVIDNLDELQSKKQIEMLRQLDAKEKSFKH